MKLSDEIAKNFPANTKIERCGQLFNKNLSKVCVLGNVYINGHGNKKSVLKELRSFVETKGTFGSYLDYCFEALEVFYPELKKNVKVPKKFDTFFGIKTSSLYNFITVLNDSTKMTPKQISKEVKKLGY